MGETDEKEYVIGAPVPISELKIARAPHYPWWAILKAIPEGTAQQVTMSFTSSKRAVETFVKEGKLKKGEYEVRSTTGEKGKRRIFILHHAIRRK